MISTETVLTVTSLNERVKTLLESNAALKNISVCGEVSSYKRHPSGHVYFSLKDDRALVNCVMFKSNAASLTFAPTEGMKVIARGRASLYVDNGKYQFYVDAMNEAGEGELYRQFILLKEKLDKEGIFSRKRPIPFLPKCVGVVTSETGAAFYDIKTVIERRFPKMNILLAPAKVQGADAPSELINALDIINASGKADVIIIGRGGGSYEDLSCFNDEALARKIFSSKLPVISAVGHEVDFTIADFAADMRAPTPSAAAELCVPEYSAIAEFIDVYRERMDNIVASNMSNAKKHIALLSRDKALADPKTIIELKRNAIKTNVSKLENEMIRCMNASHARLNVLKQKLDALDPYAVLKRGYAMITDEKGNTINKASQLKSGDSVNIRLHDGTAGAEIK